MAAHFVLVASPLVGPAGWRWVADELVTMGLPVVVPDLAAADAPAPVWNEHVDAIVREIPPGDDLVLVGHSAAGRLIPLVADRIDPNATCVFVDAQLPAEAALPAPDDDWFLAHIRSLATTDGVLPPWSEWWGTDAWNALIPDPRRRRFLADAMPRVTLASVEAEPPPPTLWTGLAAYLRFSELFDEHAEAARERGWVVDELPGEHLHMVVDPPAVAAKLVALAHRAADTYGSSS